MWILRKHNFNKNCTRKGLIFTSSHMVYVFESNRFLEYRLKTTSKLTTRESMSYPLY